MATSRKNPYLKGANEQHEYTPEQIQELGKCIDDADYFINTYCQIQHATEGSIPFTLRPYQKNIISTFSNNRLSILLSPRQTGKCVYPNSSVVTLRISSINRFKKLLLFILDRKQYDELYKDV